MSRDFSRYLRRNMTDAERRLWRHLRHRQCAEARFRRQAPIGPYIVDFACFEHNLIVELDGGQHAERREDEARTAWLNSQGYRVMRFWNCEVFEDLEAILEAIGRALRDDPPPQPSPTRGEGVEGAAQVGDG
jgi:very-short-patch-repair endonuclease